MSEFKDISTDTDIFGRYTPLERPLSLQESTSSRVSCVDTDDDESSSSSFSSMDKFLKKRKSDNKCIPLINGKLVKKQKYEGWQACCNEDLFSEFGSLLVRGNSRHIESYNFHMNNASVSRENLANDPGVIESNGAAENGNGKSESGFSTKPRLLPKLKASPRDSNSKLGAKISACLRERNVEVITRIVELLGSKEARDLYRQTRAVEKNGGMLVLNGKRRRTSGGVFITLAKEKCDLSNEQNKNIFLPDSAKDRRRDKRRKHRELQRMRKRANILNSDAVPDVITSDGEYVPSSPPLPLDPPSITEDDDNDLKIVPSMVHEQNIGTDNDLKIVLPIVDEQNIGVDNVDGINM